MARLISSVLSLSVVLSAAPAFAQSEAAGLVTIVLGAVMKREVRVRERPGLSVGLAPTRGGASLALSGAF